eukprot:scaffold22203_cov64-Phaeocystis_antarctica.AAC.1
MGCGPAAAERLRASRPSESSRAAAPRLARGRSGVRSGVRVSGQGQEEDQEQPSAPARVPMSKRSPAQCSARTLGAPRRRGQPAASVSVAASMRRSMTRTGTAEGGGGGGAPSDGNDTRRAGIGAAEAKAAVGQRRSLPSLPAERSQLPPLEAIDGARVRTVAGSEDGARPAPHLTARGAAQQQTRRQESDAAHRGLARAAAARRGTAGTGGPGGGELACGELACGELACGELRGLPAEAAAVGVLLP